MDALLHDLRYAVRGLARSPGFAAAALLTLAIGTGANATVFSLVNAMLLRPTPVVRDPASLYSVFTSDFSSGPYGTSSYPDFLSLREAASAFSGLTAYTTGPAVLRAGNSTERVVVMSVSAEFFELLGLHAGHGRLLARGDFAADATPAAVISDHFWRRTFGGDPAVLGRALSINGQPATIVGVAPEGFDGLNLGTVADVWSPLPAQTDPAARRSRSLSLVGRLRERATLESAQAELDTIAANLARAFPASNLGTLDRPDRPRPIIAVPHSRLHPRFRATVAMLGAVLMAAVAVVLAVACANVAGLLLSRSAARARELATRAALGASTSRLLRQLVTESVLLALCGGALGTLFALWTSDALPSFFPAEQARILDARVDLRVVAFAAVLSVATGTLLGMLPSLRILRGVAAGRYSGGGPISDARTGIMRSGLVLSQVALTFVLLVACGLFVRSLANAFSADLGFGTRDVAIANLEIPSGELDTRQGAAYSSRCSPACAPCPASSRHRWCGRCR